MAEPLTDKELEALRWAATHPAEVVDAEGKAIGEMPNSLERRLLATVDALQTALEGDEALRLLELARRWLPVGNAPPDWQEPILKWREDVDRILAQPTAAWEAVVVEAIKHSVGDWAKHIDCEQGHCLACALADTSPAAAALLAQGEEMRELLQRAEKIIGLELEPAPAHMQPDGKIKGAALEVVDWLKSARAALAPGEETDGD